MGLQMLMGPPHCQQEVFIMQPLNCNRMYLSQFVTLVGLPLLKLTYLVTQKANFGYALADPITLICLLNRTL